MLHEPLGLSLSSCARFDDHTTIFHEEDHLGVREEATSLTNVDRDRDLALRLIFIAVFRQEFAPTYQVSYLC